MTSSSTIRGFVFLCITFFYARLFVFLRRPDKIRSPYSPQNTSNHHYSTVRTGDVRRKLSHLWKRSRIDEKPKTEVLVETKPLDLASPRPSLPISNATPLASPMSEIPPWERVELPVFQVDGQRYGGTSAQTSGNMWGNWKGLSGGSVRDPKKRPSSPPINMSSRYGSASTGHDVSLHPSPPNIITPHLENIPTVAIVDPDFETSPTSVPDFGRRQSGDFAGSNWYLDRIRKGSVLSAPISELGPITPSASTTHLAGQHDSFDPKIRRDSAITEDSRRSSVTPDNSKRELLPVHREITTNPDMSDIERQHAAEDDQWDLMRVLQQTAPPKTANDRFAPAEGDTVEFVEESMASYLNRKTALLMLWFPLGVSWRSRVI